MATAKKKAPAKRISRTNITEKQYVERPSQITRAAPTKRAKARRQTHLDSGLPAGYYPNPQKKIASTIIPGSLASEKLGKLYAIGVDGSEPFAWFKKKGDATTAAHAYADALNKSVYVK